MGTPNRTQRGLNLGQRPGYAQVFVEDVERDGVGNERQFRIEPRPKLVQAGKKFLSEGERANCLARVRTRRPQRCASFPRSGKASAARPARRKLPSGNLPEGESYPGSFQRLKALKTRGRRRRSEAVKSIPSLIACFEHEEYQVNGAAKTALAYIGDPAIPALLATLKNPNNYKNNWNDPKMRESLERAMKMIPENMRANFIKAQENHVDAKATGTVMTLWLMGPAGKPAVPTLIPALVERHLSDGAVCPNRILSLLVYKESKTATMTCVIEGFFGF